MDVTVRSHQLTRVATEVDANPVPPAAEAARNFAGGRLRPGGSELSMAEHAVLQKSLPANA